jgi:hypothetical protein
MSAIIVPGKAYPSNPTTSRVAAAGLQKTQVAATIDAVPSPDDGNTSSSSKNPFQPGTMVVVTLSAPREKFWGAILTLSADGLSLCGIELASFDDLVSMVKDNEPFSPSVVFFPMHRVERMELDLPDGNIPSLSQRFSSKTGLNPARVLVPGTAHTAEEQK